MSSQRVNVLIGRSGLKYSGKRARWKGGSDRRSSSVVLLVAQEAGIPTTAKLVSESPAPLGSSSKISPASFSLPSPLPCVHPHSTNYNVDQIKMHSMELKKKSLKHQTTSNNPSVCPSPGLYNLLSEESSIQMPLHIIFRCVFYVQAVIINE